MILNIKELPYMIYELSKAINIDPTKEEFYYTLPGVFKSRYDLGKDILEFVWNEQLPETIKNFIKQRLE